VVWLEIIDRKNLVPRNEAMRALSECNELIAIFVASTKTADANEKSRSKIKSQHSPIINPTRKSQIIRLMLMGPRPAPA